MKNSKLLSLLLLVVFTGNMGYSQIFCGTTIISANTPVTNRAVGIGASNPSGAALHVVGGSTGNLLPPAIKLERRDGTNQAGVFTIGISGSGFANAGLGGGSVFLKLEDPFGNSPNSDMAFSTNGTAPQLVIKHNGSVKIGNVTTPTGYKLYVESGILTEKVKVAVAGSVNWADYVFNKNYRLMSLEDVEDFIQKHKHLPNVPSTKDLESDGLDLGQMQAKQMEKIEELTLYIIDISKQLKALKQENKQLRQVLNSTKK